MSLKTIPSIAPETACVIYARYSSSAQNPKSCDDQVNACREFAAKAGWVVIEVFRDDAVSGSRGREDRKGWDQLIEYVESGKVSTGAVVLTWDLDRWSRDWSDGMIEALRLHKAGVNLADTKDGVLEQDGLVGRLMLTLKIANADDFIQKLSRNIRRGLTSKREAGCWTSPPPFGCVTERVSCGASTAAILAPGLAFMVVKRIYVELDKGGTPTKLARALNVEGVPTARGGAWTAATIRSIATNTAYAGIIARYDSKRRRANTRYLAARGMVEYIPANWKPMLDLELHRRVRDRWLPKPHQKSPRFREYPLSGLVVCGECGRTAQIAGGAWPYRNYRCGAYGVKGCGNGRLARVTLLEEAVRAWLTSVVTDAPAVDIAAREISVREREEAARQADTRLPLERRRLDIENEINACFKLIKDGGAPGLVNKRLSQLEAELGNIEKDIGAAGEAIETAPIEMVKQLILDVLKRGQLDLHAVRDIVGSIAMPADPDQPIMLHALGSEWPLVLARTTKDRTRAAALRGMKVVQPGD